MQDVIVDDKLKTKFFSLVCKTLGTCWIWLGGKTSAKYGTFYYNGNTYYAHRISWLIHYGDIPEGMLVCHHCDNPSCVYPTHLFLGTDKTNAIDKCNKNRQAIGLSLPHSKLSPEKILQIRDAYFNENIGQKELAEEFGVNQSTISRAIHKQTWKHII